MFRGSYGPPVPYQAYPTTWPKYLPKSKVATFQRFYADSQDLNIWTSTTIQPDPPPKYDTETQRWTVTVDRDGKHITLRPRHLVFATGFSVTPKTINVPGMQHFSGKIFHTSQREDANQFKDKDVVIVGTVSCTRLSTR